MFCCRVCLLYFLFLCFSCGWSKRSAEPSQGQALLPVVVPADSTDQILLLSFKLYKDTTAAGSERIDLEQRQIINGRLKKRLQSTGFIEPGMLICRFSDHTGRILDSFIVENPLTASIEYPDEQGALQRITPERQTAELFLRVQKYPTLSKLVIGKYLSVDQIQELAVFKL